VGNITDYHSYDLQKSNIYIDDDLESHINKIVEKKVEEILSKRDLMGNLEKQTKAKIQLIFGQDVFILPKGKK